MRQTWRDLTFLHWRYDPGTVRPLVPAGLELDLHDGAAWIGLVPFFITDLTHPRLPSVPWLSHFPETNVRTYVVDPQGRRGVWFFSLDAARLLAVIGARAGFSLPYFWARMSVERSAGSTRYISERLQTPHARSAIEIAIGERLPEATELEVFLTARFRLFAQRGKRILKADIEHPPWPLAAAHVIRLEENLVQAAGLPPPHGEPLAHFAERVDVMVAAPQKV